jgi:hypothetical protein
MKLKNNQEYTKFSDQFPKMYEEWVTDIHPLQDQNCVQTKRYHVFIMERLGVSLLNMKFP